MPSKIKPFECSACNAAFHMKCFLNMHVRKVHGKEFDESMAKNAKIEEGKKTKEGEKLTISDRDPVKSAMSDEVYILVHILLFSFSYLQIYSLIY